VNCEFFLLQMASRKRKTRARVDDIPSSSAPAPQSASAGPDAQSSQTTVAMLHSLFQGQAIIMQSLQELTHHMPITNVEQFLEQIVSQ